MPAAVADGTHIAACSSFEKTRRPIASRILTPPRTHRAMKASAGSMSRQAQVRTMRTGTADGQFAGIRPGKVPARYLRPFSSNYVSRKSEQITFVRRAGCVCLELVARRGTVASPSEFEETTIREVGCGPRVARGKRHVALQLWVLKKMETKDEKAPKFL